MNTSYSDGVGVRTTGAAYWSGEHQHYIYLHHPCLSVCLFGCEQDISKGCGQILTKLGGQVGFVSRTNQFDVVEDPDPDTGIV